MTIQGRSRTGIVEIPCGGGIVSDDVEHELLEPIWTDGLNVRFGGGFVRKTEGYAQTLSSVAAPVRHVCSLQSAGNSWVSITDTNIYADDGITQRVTAKAGVARVAVVDLPNPVELYPYRTFLDVEQPASKFVLRIKADKDEGPRCALFEADGGAWRATAVETIKSYMVDNLDPAKAIIIA